MKLPKAQKLDSGNWRIQMQIDKKRYSITAATKQEVQKKAKQLYAGLELEKRIPLTVGKAMDQYILEKTGTLSPSTIRGYKAVRRNYLQGIMNLNVSDLTQGDIQWAVSNDSIDGKSPKTIRNAHGLLAAVLDEFRPELILRTRLPQKENYEVHIPSEDEIRKLWSAAKDTKYFLPILLASWFGLRMSEIRGLKYGDISDGKIHVQRALVRGEKGVGSVEKGTKTTSGDRWIILPKEIQKLIGESADQNSYICPYAEITIYKNFVSICEKAGVEPFRFHDLRHFAASEAHALGVPDKYAMKRMGHKTDNMLKTVYQHTMDDKETAFSKVIDDKMGSIYAKI